MSARQPLAAGVIVAGLATAVLLGWTFDITFTKSVMAGWRVMVPATAATFVLIGIALIFATGHRGATPSVLAARIVAALAMALPLLTFIEYLGDVRFGVESWFGVRFDVASPVAGRMSPLATVCCLSLAGAVAAATVNRPRTCAIARVSSGSTLLTAWLAILVVGFDAGRLADAPRFPGMAALTIVLMAVAAWGALGLTFENEGFRVATGARASRAVVLLVIAFAVPLALGWIRDVTYTRLPQQVVSAVLVFLLTITLASIIWMSAARMAALRRDRERALAELEQRVDERTRELASRNAELRLSEDRLRDADRRKDEFLATLAHELRNPLAPIRNAVAVLRADGVTDTDRHEASTIIDRQVAHMVRLIDDLLDVSRITAGKLPLYKAAVHLHDVIAQAVATVQPHLDEARHRLRITLPREPIVIEGDDARLSQVFANLLHNACKYTEPGGEIEISASVQHGAEVAIRVRDNGIGIPEEFLPRLFEKFSQVAPALLRSQGGLGLGLSLVQGIVVAHGGRVEALSAGSGHGSEFIVHLPVATAVASRAPVNGRGATADDRVPRRVMVVDDNEDSAESMAMLLRLNGHVVEIAYDGERALEIAERFRPDAILLDIGMPKLNGFEVCQRVRSSAWGASMLLIAQTGWGQDQDRARTLEAGFDAHLTKPIDPDAIQDMLANLKPV